MKKKAWFFALLASACSWANASYSTFTPIDPVLEQEIEEAALGLTEIECTLTPLDPSIRTVNPSTIYLNWSGYAAYPKSNATGSVTAAAGSWVVPKLLATPDNTYTFVFVGIDGYSNGTVEQIGTAHYWVNGAQQNFAWFEMYPAGLFKVSNFPMNIGDVVSGRVTYKGNGVFQFVINNLTKKVTTTIPTSYTTSTTAQRATAEWIVEAPYNSGILPLSDFQTITWNYCSATIHGVTGAINNSNWQNDVITMKKNGKVESQPSALLKNGTSFQVTWKAE